MKQVKATLLSADHFQGDREQVSDKSTNWSDRPQQLEEEAFALLGAGRQSDAERLLETSVEHLIEARTALGFARRGRRRQAARAREELYREWQRIVFLLTACRRSRSLKSQTLPAFLMTMLMDESSPAGRASLLLLLLDGAEQVQSAPEATLDELRTLVAAHPDDHVLRWMLAIQCRAFHRYEEGIEHCRRLFTHWKPGPSLLHQTYASLLDGFQRCCEAMVEHPRADGSRLD